MNKVPKIPQKIDWLNVVEELAAAVTLINTFALVIARNTVSYEPTNSLDSIQKSSYPVILQHNPVFGYAYLACAFIVMACALRRYLDWKRQKNLPNLRRKAMPLYKMLRMILKEWKRESGSRSVMQFSYDQTRSKGYLTIYTSQPDLYIGKEKGLLKKYEKILKENVYDFEKVHLVKTDKHRI